MAGKLVILGFGLSGVNVDKNPLEMGDDELLQAQNAVSGPTSGRASIQKRRGFVRFTTDVTAGDVLGGVDLPLADESGSGIHYIYIGRGATS